MQKAIVVYLTEKKNNLSDLNQLLQEGWKVVSQSAMSGAGGGGAVYSLVIIEKD
ncbi:hypothetical protein IFT92_19385 [Peribacillus simplex]|uniref:hypothetical protein n=1 Tax=Peribacillus simplex TaxID=1478 RepID=UPI0019210435|nr:hypothetical protein [Peribacillus simplex]MBD8589957.1 hypothetical protein [Peribacillus simplex]